MDVDLAKPLLPQVAALDDDYDAWVHEPAKRPGSLRIFESDAMESLSHVRWWHVLVLWAPVAAGLFVAATHGLGATWSEVLPWAAGGIALWTLLEYVLHRFVFHHRFSSALGRRFHFLAHGIHHLDPWDKTRLVFPPVPAAIVAAAVFGLYRAALPLPHALAALSGTIAGYLVYDMTHYFAHHGKPRSRWGKALKAWHLAHHHKHPQRMFGVSQPLWDVVFRTGKPAGP